MSGIEPWPSPYYELRDALERVRLDLLHREAVLDHAAASAGLDTRDALPIAFLHENAEPHRVPRSPAVDEALTALTHHLTARSAATDDDVKRFSTLVRELDLDEIERHVLLTAIAPQFSTGFMQSFDRLVPGHERGKIPLMSLADLVAQSDPQRWHALAALRPDARLRTTGLLVAEGPASPGLARTDAQTSLSVSPVVLDYLLADHTGPRPFALQGVARRIECDRDLDTLPLAPSDRLALKRLAGHEGKNAHGALRVGVLVTHGHSAKMLAEAIATEADRNLLIIEGLFEGSSQAALHAYRQLALHARLHELTLLVEILDAPPESAWSFFLEAIGECPQVLVCSRHPLRSLERLTAIAAMSVELPPLSSRERTWAWRDALPPDEADAMAHAFPFDLEEIQSMTARMIAARDVWRIARQRLSTPLEGIGERLETKLTLDDLVLPPEVRARLDEIATFIVHSPLDGRRRMSALFHGPSGTGKTSAATALARTVGRPIMKVDVAIVVDRYLPDIERRLERFFERAAADEAILLFEDVDALFGKRSDNAQDRFANVQVNLLVQRMEAHPGLSIATVHALEAVDPAFRRRTQFQVQLPKPGADARQRLWRAALHEATFDITDALINELATTFDLSGGGIRKAVSTATVLVAGQGVKSGDESTALVASLREAARRESRSIAVPPPTPRPFGL